VINGPPPSAIGAVPRPIAPRTAATGSRRPVAQALCASRARAARRL